MNVVTEIKAVLTRVCADLNISEPAEGLVLEHPSDLKNGDYATGVALQCAKQVKIAPRALAEEIVAALGKIKGISKIEVAGAGFINFYLATPALAEGIETARREDMPARRSLGAGGWGANTLYTGKKIMVEYTDPNPFKEFHIGHLMSNAIGESIARLLQFSGAEVKRVNYQGDIGLHVAKAIWGYQHLEDNIRERKANFHLGEKEEDVELNNWGIAYKLGSARYEETNGEIKKEIDEVNKKIYDGSDEIKGLYERGRKLTLKHFEVLYKILGTKFDYSFFESETGPRGVKIVRTHPKIFEESEGAVVFKGEQYGLHTRVFVNKLGLPTYEAKDLGLAELKKGKAAFDVSYTITAHEQADYFRVVLKALELIHPDWSNQFKHISHGMMRIASGKMSSRTGNVITGESLISDLAEAARERAKESRAEDHEQLAQAVAVAAIKYQILKQGSGKDIVFDRERALSLEGDSGPYLQYAHARAQQLVEKAKEQGVVARVDKKAEPNELTRLLYRFPEVVEYAACELEPHLLTNYLLEIASTFNGWYAQVHILDGSTSSPHKVALTAAFARTMKNGLWLLGIPAPEKM